MYNRFTNILRNSLKTKNPLKLFFLLFFFFGIIILIENSQSGIIWLFFLLIIIIFTSLILYQFWNNKRWEKIELLNYGLGINKNTTYIDRNGYLRWKHSDRLCHRDIAWESNIRGITKFGICDVHHKDGNKFNNQPNNLEVLTREQHKMAHGEILKIDGKKYYRLSYNYRNHRQTARAYLIAGRWIPKSQVLIKNNSIYIPEWLYLKKGFGGI